MEYEQIRRIGRGGMGVVDLARDAEGREVALKRLSLHGTPEELERARQRIRREAETLQRLDHPAIVQLLDVVDDDDDLVLVMDYLPGGNLAQRVAEGGPLGSADLRVLADRLLDALAAAHRQGVVHRDIKPANVLFAADGQAALADFGAAIHRDATPGLTASEMVVGTPGFMSPEQARGEPATAASDVFSLGATLLFAATGAGPFGTADPRVLMLRAAAGRTERAPKTIVPDLRRRIDAMLDKDPDRRPTAARAKGGTDGTHPRTAARVRVPARRNRAFVGAALLVALAVAAAIAVLTGGDGNGGRLQAAPTTEARAASTTSTSEPCTPLPYQPCDGVPAPNTDGERCDDGYADFDGKVLNGCEAEDHDPPPGTALAEKLTANLVPADDVDRWDVPVDDERNLLGDGRVTIALTAPAGAVMRLTVFDDDGDALGTAISADQEEVEVSLEEPNFGRDDGTTLVAQVEYASSGATPTSRRYRLTRSGNY